MMISFKCDVNVHILGQELRIRTFPNVLVYKSQVRFLVINDNERCLLRIYILNHLSVQLNLTKVTINKQKYSNYSQTTCKTIDSSSITYTIYYVYIYV